MIVTVTEGFSQEFNALDGGIQLLLRPILEEIYTEFRIIASIEEIDNDEFSIGTELTDDIEGIDPGDKIYSIELIDGYYLFLSIFGNATEVCYFLSISRTTQD
mgnify:CR=1 FL=1